MDHSHFCDWGIYCDFEGLLLRGTWRFVVRGIHAVLRAVQYTYSFMSQMCKNLFFFPNSFTIKVLNSPR